MSELEKLESLLSIGKITRREFMARLSALGLTAAISPALLTSPARASTPKKGGRLRLGVVDSVIDDSLDQTLFVTAFGFVNSVTLRNCLVELDQNTRPIPELAESLEPATGAAKWIIKLRKGVEFHNGKTLEAEDVIYSINRHRGENTKSAGKALVSNVVDIKADGKYTLIFTLSGGSADFPYFLSDPRMSISPAGTENFNQGIGTGGYMLESFGPGVRMLAKRNPNYWKKGRANFDEVEIVGINDVVARTNALVTGEIDVMNRCARRTFDRLVNKPGIQGIETNGPAHYVIPMRTDTAPFDNNNIRLALKHAIDRKVYLKNILSGHGYLGNDHPISRDNIYFASELPQRQYDPEKAKYYLKKAGLTKFSVKLHASEAAYPGAVDAAVLYKENAVKAGIDIEVVRTPADGYWSHTWMKQPWCFSYWFGRPSADWMFSIAYAETSSQNETFWKHERFNKLLVEARAELDEAKRREMYVELQRIVRDEGGNVIPIFNNDLMAANDKVRFGKVAGNMQLDGLRIAERWWFA